MEGKTFIYQNPNHGANLNKMRLSNKWCDLTIKVNDQEIRAHKLVLAANLKYFEMMFTNDSYQESKEGVITMQCVEGGDLEAFITYAYTGEIILTNSNALQLLEVANYLNEDGIKAACIEFLTKHLKAEQACRAYSFANSIECLLLKNAAKQMILSDFATCSQSTDFLQLDQGDLKNIISIGKTQSPLLHQKFFEGIMRWIMHIIQQRRDCLNDLLNLIDLKKLEADDLIGYLYKHVIDFNDQYGIMKDVMSCYYTNKVQKIESQEALLIGNVSDNFFVFQFFNFTEKKWSPLMEIPGEDYEAIDRAIIFKDKFYYYVRNLDLQLKVFDPLTKKITMLQSSSNILSDSCMCKCSSFLYFCGGRHRDFKRSDQILKFDPSQNSFEVLPPMKVKRSNAAAIFYKGSLLVLGGTRSEMKRLFAPDNSVEKYNPVTKKWTDFPSMREPRYAHAVAVLDEKLYVCGGRKKRSVEVYDPSKNMWQLVASMNEVKSDFLLVAYKGKLLAVGGSDVRTAEVYDPNKNEWQLEDDFFTDLQVTDSVGGLISSSCIADTS